MGSLTPRPSSKPALRRAGQEVGPSLKKEPRQAHSPLHLREGLLQAAPGGPHNLSEGAEGLAQEILHIGVQKKPVSPTLLTAIQHPLPPTPLEV